LSDHDVLIRLDENVKQLVEGFKKIDKFLSDCPVHRQKLEDHLQNHRRTTSIIIAIYGPLAGLIGVIIEKAGLISALIEKLWR